MINTPNILSILRLCLVPVFVVLYFSGLENARLISFAVYLIAVITDYLDGYIARRFNLITNLGKVLDPLGDKMLTFSVLACMSIDGIIPMWVIPVLAVKEILMGVGGIIIHNKAKAPIPPSNMLGKTATVVFFITCAALLLFELPQNVSFTMIVAALSLSLAAFAVYAVKYISIMRTAKEGYK